MISLNVITTTSDNTFIGLKYEVIEGTSPITYNRYAGIGSVLKLIPGIDILSGDNTNPLIGGMPCVSMNETAFNPLNINK